MGWAAKGSREKAARTTLDAARHTREDRSPLSAAGDDPRGAWAPVIPIGPRVRGAPSRHRARIARSVSRDSFFHPTGPWALHRRRRRSAPSPRRNARARHPDRPGREPRPGPQRTGRRRSLSRPSAQDTARDANEHGLRAAQLSKAPSGTVGCRPAKLGSSFRRLAASADKPGRLGRHGRADDVDGCHRLATRRRSIACRGTSGGRPTATPHLISADVPADAADDVTNGERCARDHEPLDHRRTASLPPEEAGAAVDTDESPGPVEKAQTRRAVAPASWLSFTKATPKEDP